MSMISLILPSLIVINQIGCIIFHLCRAHRDPDNLLSASDYINFAFNFALTVTLIFYVAETTYT